MKPAMTQVTEQQRGPGREEEEQQRKKRNRPKKKRSPPPPPTSCDIEREEHMAKQKVGKRKRRKWELHAQYQVLYLCNVIHLSYAMVSLIAWGIPHPI